MKILDAEGLKEFQLLFEQSLANAITALGVSRLRDLTTLLIGSYVGVLYELKAARDGIQRERAALTNAQSELERVSALLRVTQADLEVALRSNLELSEEAKDLETEVEIWI